MNAWVTWLTKSGVRGNTKHFIGMPPEPDAKDHRHQLPGALILVIRQTDEGFFLDRYTNTGEFAGDTWHATLDDAIFQADFEFGQPASPWLSVPEGKSDAISFALECRRSAEVV